MDNATHAPQAPSPFGFDSTGLAEMLADAITARIAEELNSDGLVDQTELRAVVAKIKKVVGQIADDPLGFANNLLQGLAQLKALAER